MAVPCGDQRDWEFATYFDIEIINIFKDIDISESANEDKEFPDDIDDEEMITYHVTYNVLEDWFMVEPVVTEVFMSDSEVEILLNKIQDNVH